MTALLVALAGGLGAASRFCVDAAVKHLLPGTFPVGTVAINVSGSFLLGWLTALATADALSQTALTVLGIGFCGGYTTFGTAMIETLRLQQRDRSWLAVLNHLGTVVLCVLAAAAGLLLGR